MGFNNPGRAKTDPGKAKVPGAPKYGTSGTATIGVAASVSSVAPGLLAEAIDLVTLSGDLISFTRTSDGGAWCIYVKSGADGYKFYPHNTAELEETLVRLAEGAR